MNERYVANFEATNPSELAVAITRHLNDMLRDPEVTDIAVEGVGYTASMEPRGLRHFALVAFVVTPKSHTDRYPTDHCPGCPHPMQCSLGNKRCPMGHRPSAIPPAGPPR